MSNKEGLTQLQRELLESMNGTRTHHDDGLEMRWGAWMSACLESLVGCGFVTRGPQYEITESGRRALDGKE
jgi:hypothetical protein